MLTDVRPTAPPLPRPGLLAGHHAFAVVLALAAALRVIVMLGYPPARLYWYDSFEYLDTAVHLRPGAGFHPIGYSLFLRLLLPFHSVGLIAAVQHVMGLAIGVMVYALLRRRSLPVWAACLAAAPVLFAASFFQLEHAVLSDTPFMFLITAGLTTLMWSPRLSARAATGAGLLFAFAALTRTIALPLLLLVVVVLAFQRVGRRPLIALAVSGTLPLAAYAGWYGHHHGRFALSGADGVSLWARTMTFADCSVIRPPAGLAPLCPNATVVDAASEYVWAPGASLNLLPGDRMDHNDEARAFAIRAIAAQPFDYLLDVARDTSIAFAWTPIAHPKRVTPAFGYRLGGGGLPDQPLVERARRAYDPRMSDARAVRPWADFLIAYQYPAYLRGPVLAALLLLGAAGAVARRRAVLLPWSLAVALLVCPVAVLDFDHRYVLPVVPFACLAAALALHAIVRPPLPGNRRPG
ncbi:hypothetical protein GCM10023194_00400 [Planotetraspora phitsanulokensis]|uniref:Glycosyltransferase RgtA/B/C/D-like domain-containing protein n=1 Tax=Planotetraspora phitsanulokensis TaxID=575192 RepID=A0A8J3XHL1_9ACTN|nr:hypothetical protein [Planotetraspora phitsanulokensis]GII40071.1 hypothetical protein Pph01_50740 [Planotetraspora phitsanulokensis]